MRLLIICGVFGAGLLYLADMLVPRWFSPESARPIVAAGAICVVSAWLALIPPAMVRGRAEAVAQAGLGMVLIRLFLSLAAGWLYLRMYSPPQRTFLAAMTVWYLSLLALETWMVLRLASRDFNADQAS